MGAGISSKPSPSKTPRRHAADIAFHARNAARSARMVEAIGPDVASWDEARKLAAAFDELRRRALELEGRLR